MNIPDPMVWASIPVLGGAVVWVGQQFVQSVVSRNRENLKINADALAGAGSFTLPQYRQVSDLLKNELNGRYMCGAEARERFASIETKIDRLGQDVRQLAESHLSARE